MHLNLKMKGHIQDLSACVALQSNQGMGYDHGLYIDMFNAGECYHCAFFRIFGAITSFMWPHISVARLSMCQNWEFDPTFAEFVFRFAKQQLLFELYEGMQTSGS